MIIDSYTLEDLLKEDEEVKIFKAKKNDSTKTYIIKIFTNFKADRGGRVSLGRLRKDLDEIKGFKSIINYRDILVAHKGEFSGQVYISWEYVDGKTWDEYPDKSSLQITTTLRWAYELTKCIAYLHAKDIIHGELKPSNIIFVGTHLRLLNTGTSRHLQLKKDSAEKIRYMSPEQFSPRENITKASDIYSLGLLLHEIISYDHLYAYGSIDIPESNKNEWKNIHSRESDTITNRAIHPSLKKIIRQCLKNSPEKRPSIHELVMVLEKEIPGLDNPSYVSIIGVRGSGKTCYLCSIADSSRKDGLKVNFIRGKERFENAIKSINEGQQPPPTGDDGFIDFNFEFSKDIEYSINAQDYAGEIVSYIIDDSLDTSKKQKLEEFLVYLKNARAVLFLVETPQNKKILEIDEEYVQSLNNKQVPSQLLKELLDKTKLSLESPYVEVIQENKQWFLCGKRQILDEKITDRYSIVKSKNNIEVFQLPIAEDIERQITALKTLATRLSEVENNIRQIKVPVALVLTKWDRQGFSFSIDKKFVAQLETSSIDGEFSEIFSKNGVSLSSRLEVTKVGNDSIQNHKGWIIRDLEQNHYCFVTTTPDFLRVFVNISMDEKFEKGEALNFIHKAGALCNLYQHLKKYCKYFDVFPVFAFIGDNILDNRYNFGIHAPWVWATKKAQQNEWENCVSYENEIQASKNPILVNYQNAIELYWNLLKNERLDENLKNKVAGKIQSLSELYLEQLQQKHPI